ncbi:hypothetical protein D3C71_2008380 [compost metagenome]
MLHTSNIVVAGVREHIIAVYEFPRLPLLAYLQNGIPDRIDEFEPELLLDPARIQAV